MKPERNARKRFKNVHKMFTYEGVSNIDIMTKTQREGMMKIANNKKGKPPIWYDDVPRDGYSYDVLQFINEWSRRANSC